MHLFLWLSYFTFLLCFTCGRTALISMLLRKSLLGNAESEYYSASTEIKRYKQFPKLKFLYSPHFNEWAYRNCGSPTETSIIFFSWLISPLFLFKGVNFLPSHNKIESSFLLFPSALGKCLAFSEKWIYSPGSTISGVLGRPLDPKNPLPCPHSAQPCLHTDPNPIQNLGTFPFFGLYVMCKGVLNKSFYVKKDPLV